MFKQQLCFLQQVHADVLCNDKLGHTGHGMCENKTTSGSPQKFFAM